MKLSRGLGLPAKVAFAMVVAVLVVLFGVAIARADELAYSCEEDICVIDPDHPEAHQDLTKTPLNGDLEPAWSPDGSTLAFNGTYTGRSDIYLTSPSTPGVGTDITNSAEIQEGAPIWSPDGSQIAYTGTPASGSSNVYVVPASGTSAPQAIGETSAEEKEPTWSPDGTKLAFVRVNMIYVSAPTATGTPQLLANGTGVEPTWSPDGARIVAINPFDEVVKLIDAGGSGIATEEPVKAALGSTIHWSPDGSHVVYTDETDNIRVAPTNPVGPGVTITLPPGVIVPREPVFSPDGSRIAFIARHNSGNEYEQIFLAPAGGGEAVQLTKAEQSALYPEWKPGAGATIPPVVGPPTPPAGTPTPPVKTTKPTTIKFAAYEHPFVYHEGLGGYVDCALGSSNEVCSFHGEATYAQTITHSLTLARSKGKRPKAVVVAAGSVSVPGGKRKLLTMKLTAAGRKLAKPGQTLKLAVTITETTPGSKPHKETQMVKVKVPKKH